jgi:hypothetical protein
MNAGKARHRQLPDRFGDPQISEAGLRPRRRSDPQRAAWRADGRLAAETRIHHRAGLWLRGSGGRGAPRWPRNRGKSPTTSICAVCQQRRSRGRVAASDDLSAAHVSPVCTRSGHLTGRAGVAANGGVGYPFGSGQASSPPMRSPRPKSGRGPLIPGGRGASRAHTAWDATCPTNAAGGGDQSLRRPGPPDSNG